SVLQLRPTAPATWPCSYAFVSTSTSKTRTFGSFACSASQSVSTSTSFAYAISIPSLFVALVSANGCRLALGARRAGLGRHDRAQLSRLDFVDVAGDRNSVREERRLHQTTDLLAQICLEVPKREQAELVGERARPFGDLPADRFVFKGQHSAAGVLDDRELVRPEQMCRDHERSNRVVGCEPAGVPDDVRVAGADADDFLDRESCVHACDDRPT